ncbi:MULTISPECIES: hypothetical protein [Prochlorococcus]|uniref:Protein family PM-10 n=1 Tax=Prochlorococcus marinus (strain SARG / CCMP1375 / SS120) TaxID=167539 RepID=Q7VCM2_PROMA|nr:MULTISPECIES: hypothetical protein [Prochlorococcus]AAP99762.1 Predicted protein family PM-10 [Prochlorococcus marinus subsp. marinus str. CCMP1375]KGG12763.1 putative protein family PM-10 [Prochlorococcus marinus str. LG]KGG22462.1 putative protein family PM-10 [Prochlorococcus marinus str. SS2]KGG23795.1 putative protein family PM-10 [Prochlorococcus marinus str. SS35]KGG34478.1 putative protein family PM-10 [Prochlorococcus sp. SS52]
MTSLRERLNAHFSIGLQFISTISLLILAITAVCGSRSLKRIADSHEIYPTENVHENQIIKRNHKH